MRLIPKGTPVFVNSTWSTAQTAVVTDIIEIDGKFYGYKLHGTGDNHGDYGEKAENVFLNYDEAIAAYRKAVEDQTEEYMESIRTVEDLINFCIGNMHGEEYTDHEAIKAAETMRDRFKEQGLL